MKRMAGTLNTHAAKTHLSKLLDEVVGGREFVIARAGRPVARLVPYQAAPRPKKYGLMKGRIWIADDFDSQLDPETFAPRRAR